MKKSRTDTCQRPGCGRVRVAHGDKDCACPAFVELHPDPSDMAAERFSAPVMGQKARDLQARERACFGGGVRVERERMITYLRGRLGTVDKIAQTAQTLAAKSSYPDADTDLGRALGAQSMLAGLLKELDDSLSSEDAEDGDGG